MKKWLEREPWSAGKERGKERERESRGWVGGWGRGGLVMVGSKPQNWLVILFRVWAESGD